MSTENAESRPAGKDGSRIIRCEDSILSVGPDLTENLARAARLVRLLEDQQRAERVAYEKGWRECGEAMAYAATDAWKAGYDAAVADHPAVSDVTEPTVRPDANGGGSSP